MKAAEWYRGLPEGLRKSMVKFTEIFVIASVIFYAAFRFSGIDSEVGTLYFRYAESMVSGNMPYSGFDAEYPPFAMVFILLPRLISFSSFTYQIAFGLEAYAFLMAGLYWTYRIAERYTDRPGRIADLYIVFTIVLLDFVLDRYDVFPMVLLIGAIYLFTREKYCAAWFVMALGIVTKLYPAVAAPIFLIFLILRKRYDAVWKGIAICAAVAALCMLPFVIADPDTAFMFLTYHMDRGLQTESPVASVIMLLGNLGLTDISYVFNFGSDNITGNLPDTVAKFMVPLFFVCILALYAYYLIRAKRDNGKAMPAIVLASFAAVMVFMLTNKVLSSQYLVWMIPFMALMIMFENADRGQRTLWLFAVCVALTQVNLVVNYAFRDAGEEFSLLGIIVLVVRNALLIAITYLLIRDLSEKLAPSDGQL